MHFKGFELAIRAGLSKNGRALCDPKDKYYAPYILYACN